MNNELARKILDKLSLKDLYDEIKDNDNMIYEIGKILVIKKKVTFCKLIRLLIEDSIKSKDKDMSEFFKEEIINMDGTNNLSVNETAKRKVSTSTKPVHIPAVMTPMPSGNSDPCGSSRRLTPSC